MKSKTTNTWFVIAVILFAAIWGYQKFQPKPQAKTALLAGLRAVDVTNVAIIPAGALEIDASRADKNWQLQKPYNYPAQTAAIQTLLDALAKLTPTLRLTANDMSGHKNTDAEFGFDNPQFSIVITTANGQQWQLRVGNKTAPGDGVYVRLVGTDGAFVTGVDWLALLPRDATAWRDTSLVNTASQFDWVTITNGTKIIQLQFDLTNHLWWITKPLQARANSLLIVTALQQLRSTQIAKFVTDDPKVDLNAYGLQPANLDLSLGEGANSLTTLHAGKVLPDNPAQIYARRDGWNSVVAIPNDTLNVWRGSVNDFRDPYLLDLTAPLVSIEFQGEENYTLRRDGSNGWVVAGEKFPADPETVTNFIRILTSLKISDFVKDTSTATDLQKYGLAAPAKTELLTLRAAGSNVIAQIIFGASDTNRVFAKRTDESFIYAITPQDHNRIYKAGWEFRDKRIWNFSVTNVAQITLKQNGKTMTLNHDGPNSWSLAAGQGVINPLAVEETVNQLGDLSALGWIARNVTEPEKYGIKPDSLQIGISLKTGEKYALDFGAPLSSTALAAVTLDGERWAFILPPVVYQFVEQYLTIPATSP